MMEFRPWIILSSQVLLAELLGRHSRFAFEGTAEVRAIAEPPIKGDITNIFFFQNICYIIKFERVFFICSCYCIIIFRAEFNTR